MSEFNVRYRNNVGYGSGESRLNDLERVRFFEASTLRLRFLDGRDDCDTYPTMFYSR